MTTWGPAGLTVQVKLVDPANPALSVAVTSTEEDSVIDGVPEMMPDDGSMLRPDGRPVALKVKVATDDVSLATTGNGVMDRPEVLA